MTSAVSPYPKTLINILVVAEKQFAHSINNMGMKLSRKGNTVCNKILYANCVAQRLAKVGIWVTAETHARDLGISYTAGASKSNQIFKCRLEFNSNRRKRT